MHPYEVNYTIQDAKGKKSVLTVYIWRRDKYTDDRPFEGLLDPEQFAMYLGAAIDNIITGCIKKITISTELRRGDFPFDTSGYAFKTFPDPASDVEEGTLVTFNVAGGYTFSHRLPTIDESYLTRDGQLILSPAPSAVGKYIELMTQPSEDVGDWAVYPVDSRNLDIIDLEGSSDAFNFSRANQQFRP